MLLHPVPIEIVFQFSRTIGHPPVAIFPSLGFSIIHRTSWNVGCPDAQSGTNASAGKTLDPSFVRSILSRLLAQMSLSQTANRSCRPFAIFYYSSSNVRQEAIVKNLNVSGQLGSFLRDNCIYKIPIFVQRRSKLNNARFRH